MKKLWTVAAILAVAVIPLIIASSPQKKKVVTPVSSNRDDIFEWELSAE